MPIVREGEKSDWVPEGRIIPIDIDDVARLLEPWRGERPVTAATFLPGGLMNRNYRVRVGSDDVVLRFYDRDARACAKEVGLLSELHGRVAVPEVLYDTVPVALVHVAVQRTDADALAHEILLEAVDRPLHFAEHERAPLQLVLEEFAQATRLVA